MKDDARTIYVTGHRNPDTDSIAAAIGYAELKQRQDPDARYVPVRLGDVNAQSQWVLDRAGIEPPEYLEHIRLRAQDVMREEFPLASHRTPLRDVGLAMAKAEIDVIPIVDDEGHLCGVVTERDLARRYIRESSEPSSFASRPVSVDSIVEVIGGELILRPERETNGRLWAVTTDAATMGRSMGPNDIVVLGARPNAQKRAIEIGVALLVTTYDRPSDEVIEAAKAAGVGIVVSPLDSYVTGRMISLSVQAGEVMSQDDVLTIEPDDLADEIGEKIKDVHYSAAIVVDEDRRPVGMVTPEDLVNPTPREVVLVDHAEQAQSVPGVEHAHIVEILDHHHIGSIETRFPVAATFDPIGSTASLVVERFRASGREPQRSTAMLLLAAVLSDTVILSSPTTTDRDRAVVEYLEELLGIDARRFGTEMFTASSNVSDVPAADIIKRDAKEYTLSSGGRICIAQIEVVGNALLQRREELLEAMDASRTAAGQEIFALMVTDIVEKCTELLVSGPVAGLERVFGVQAKDRGLTLPGVMSRKKQVAPQVLEAM